MKRITIKLKGKFAELAGVPEFKVFASCAREAIEMLSQFPKLNPKISSTRYVAKIDEVPTMDLLDAPLTVETLTLRPQESESFQGAGGNGGVVRIVIGAILIVVGVLMPEAFPHVRAAFISMGVGMILGGLYMLLFPPEEPDEPSSERSHMLTGRNTTASGTPIPIILGEVKHAGHVLSYNVDSAVKGTRSAPVGPPPKGWRRLDAK